MEQAIEIALVLNEILFFYLDKGFMLLLAWYVLRLEYKQCVHL